MQVGARLIKSEGAAALMKGAGVFSLKRAADWTTRYLFVVMIEEALRAGPQGEPVPPAAAAAAFMRMHSTSR